MSDENWTRNALIHNDLNCPQHSFVVALSEDDSFLLLHSLRYYRLHHRSGAIYESAELVAIRFQIAERASCDSAAHRRLRNRRRYGRNQTRVEGTRDEVA